MVSLAERYTRLSTRRAETTVDIWFLQKCKEKNITPNFAKVKISHNVPPSEKLKLERKIIKLNICKHYARLNDLNVRMKTTYNQLRTTFHPVEFDLILDDSNLRTNSARMVKYDRVSRKLKRLMDLQSKPPPPDDFVDPCSGFRFHERVRNLSSSNFDEDEMKVLNLGLSYAQPNNARSRDLHFGVLAVELDVAIETISRKTKEKPDPTLRQDLFKVLQKGKNQQHHDPVSSNIKKTQKESRIINNLKKRITSENLVVSKADKGNCVVIMDRQDYIEKVETFLASEDFSILSRCPLGGFLTRFKTYIRASQGFLNEFNAPKNLCPGNPMMPRMYGLPKIHKPDVPIRPVVAFVNTPTYLLSSFILGVIKDLTGFKPKNSVISTLDLAEKIGKLKLDKDTILLSFDVKNLYTCTPKDECMELVGGILRESGVAERTKIDILTLLNFCLSQNFFKFNDKFYEQRSGLAMGNPISPFLADLFMDCLETRILARHEKITHWFRYVDDCLVLLRGNAGEALDILNDINSLHPNIEFTLEVEDGGALNFLDLALMRVDDGVSMKIFRKATQTDHAINTLSAHPFNHKMASFNSYVHRLLSLPLSPRDFQEEVLIIKQIAFNNGYSPGIVEKLISKKQKRLNEKLAYTPTLTVPNKESLYCSIPFVESSVFNKCKKLLRKHFKDLRVTTKSSNTLKQALVNSKDPLNLLDRSGIYRLRCSDCPASYIGRTFRSLRTRVKEHISLPDKSSFGHHLKFNNHSFNQEDNSEILWQVSSRNYSRLDFIEDWFIQRERLANPLCLNVQTSLSRDYLPIYRRLLEWTVGGRCSQSS